MRAEVARLDGASAGIGVAGAERAPARRDRLGVPLALLALYLVWGSTYLGMKIAIEGFPPFLMASIRYVLAGAALYAFLRARGAPAPSRAEWGAAALVGGLLLVGGNGGVAYAEQWVASGLAAMMIATTPLWAALFAGLWGRWPSRIEWVGLAVGFAGVVLLNLGSDLRAQPAGAIALVLAPMAWALGSIWSRYLPRPAGMMATAAQMLAGGALLCAVSLAAGERMPGVPGERALWAIVYLTVVGSLVGYSAYVYVLGRVRPALATSYAYVNPIVAVALGAGFAGERVTGVGIIALVVILAGVGLVVLARERG